VAESDEGSASDSRVESSKIATMASGYTTSTGNEESAGGEGTAPGYSRNGIDLPDVT